MVCKKSTPVTMCLSRANLRFINYIHFKILMFMRDATNNEMFRN